MAREEGNRMQRFLSVEETAQGGRRSAIWRLALAAGTLYLLASPCLGGQNSPSAAQKSEAAATRNVENGKKVFMKDGCYECHGREGQGAAQASGPRIGPPQRFLRSFSSYVRQPTGQMPPFTTEVISDQELADVYAYLQSRPKAVPAKDIPLLNQ
jgi:mono/diheme cytochrome c family protein